MNFLKASELGRWDRLFTRSSRGWVDWRLCSSPCSWRGSWLGTDSEAITMPFFHRGLSSPAFPNRVGDSRPAGSYRGRVRIDLHAHSSVSDGTESPAGLVAAALTAGIDVVAIT